MSLLYKGAKTIQLVNGATLGDLRSVVSEMADRPDDYRVDEIVILPPVRIDGKPVVMAPWPKDERDA